MGLCVLAGLCWCSVWFCVVSCPSASGAVCRVVARGYLGWHGSGWRSLRLQGVSHGLVSQRGGGGGERGRERGAHHDPIVITIVIEDKGMKGGKGRGGERGCKGGVVAAAQGNLGLV